MPGVLISGGQNIILPCDDKTQRPYEDGRGGSDLREIIDRAQQREKSSVGEADIASQREYVAQQESLTLAREAQEKLSNEERLANLQRLSAGLANVQEEAGIEVGKADSPARPRKRKRGKRKRTLNHQPVSTTMVNGVTFTKEQLFVALRNFDDDNLP